MSWDNDDATTAFFTCLEALQTSKNRHIFIPLDKTPERNGQTENVTHSLSSMCSKEVCIYNFNEVQTHSKQAFEYKLTKLFLASAVHKTLQAVGHIGPANMQRLGAP